MSSSRPYEIIIHEGIFDCPIIAIDVVASSLINDVIGHAVRKARQGLVKDVNHHMRTPCQNQLFDASMKQLEFGDRPSTEWPKCECARREAREYEGVASRQNPIACALALRSDGSVQDWVYGDERQNDPTQKKQSAGS